MEHRIFLCTWFFVTAVLTWLFHGLFDYLAKSTWFALDYWLILFMLTYTTALSFPLALKEGAAKAVRLFFIIGSVVWFLHPTDIFVIEPRFESIYNLLYAVAARSEFVSTLDWVLLVLHGIALLGGAYSVGGHFAQLQQVTTKDLKEDCNYSATLFLLPLGATI